MARGLRALIAPDKFKGSLTAAEVASAIARGIRSVPGARAVEFPIADGGDGTLDVMASRGFSLTSVPVSDAVGTRHSARIARFEERAIIDSAEVCGLARLSAPAPLRASSFGVGEAIRHAWDLGARTIVVGLGGSAATDAGTGMLQALGATFTDATGGHLDAGGGILGQIAAVDWSGIDPRTRETEIIGLSDVDNILRGPEGTARVFAPQKGATAQEVESLERGLDDWMRILSAVPPQWLTARPGALETHPGAGSAGGLGFGLLLLNGTLHPGGDVVLDWLDIDQALADADLLITGEGQLDLQTAGGKAPDVAARRARSAGIETIAVVGRNALRPGDTTSFSTVHDLWSRDAACASDPEVSRRLLTLIGREIATTWQHDH